MSLAEDLPRSYAGSLSRPTFQRLSRVTLADLASRSVQAEARVPLTERPEPEVREEPAVVPLTRRAERQQPQGESSLDVLDRATKGMSLILSRYRELEEHVKKVDSWTNAQIQVAEAESERWQLAATEAEKRLEDCQRNMEILIRRAEAAEQAMYRDREALTVLQDRIMQAFGMGSDMHDVIAAGLQVN